jgi:hypothetical protein
VLTLENPFNIKFEDDHSNDNGDGQAPSTPPQSSPTGTNRRDSSPLDFPPSPTPNRDQQRSTTAPSPSPETQFRNAMPRLNATGGSHPSHQQVPQTFSNINRDGPGSPGPSSQSGSRVQAVQQTLPARPTLNSTTQASKGNKSASRGGRSKRKRW